MSRGGRSRDAGPRPSLRLERGLRKGLEGPIAGVDEAGRGPWAGPVVAAAVILDWDAIPAGIDDSKRLSPGGRAKLYELILQSARVGIGIADVARIDRDNILQATLWAMQQAVQTLVPGPAAVLVDGNSLPALDCPTEGVIGGDRQSLSIAAASIMAKVTRDRLMIELGRKFQAYGFERHKGYGTAEHSRAIELHGVTRHHRRSFRPIQLAEQRVRDGPGLR